MGFRATIADRERADYRKQRPTAAVVLEEPRRQHLKPPPRGPSAGTVPAAAAV